MFLCKDAGGSIATWTITQAAANYDEHAMGVAVVASVSTTSIDFKLRAGANSAGTTTINGENNSAYFDGTHASGIVIVEYEN